MKPKFDIEDARRLEVVRSLLLMVEKDACELVSTEDSCPSYAEVVRKLRALLSDFAEMRQACAASGASNGTLREQDCWDDYIKCEDGVCRAWCS